MTKHLRDKYSSFWKVTDVLVDLARQLGYIKLNTPNVLEGRVQLPTAEVLEGQKITSVHIHVERAIGRIKNISVLKGILPILLNCQSSNPELPIRLSVFVAGSQTFQPVLIPQ